MSLASLKSFRQARKPSARKADSARSSPCTGGDCVAAMSLFAIVCGGAGLVAADLSIPVGLVCAAFGAAAGALFAEA